MQFNFDNRTKIFYALAFVALVSILSVLFNNSRKIKSTSNLVEHTKNVLHTSDMVLVDILNIETGSRGFALMGKTAFLEPYHDGLLKINQDLAALKRITNDNPHQQIRFDSLSKTIFQRIALSKAMVDAKKQSLLNDSLKINLIENGKILTDSIRHLIIAINSEEFLLLKDRKIANQNNIENSAILYFMSFILIVFIFVLIAIIMKNQKAAKQENEKLISSHELLSQYSLSLIEASLDPLVTINIEGKITDMNEATATITGLDRDHLVGSDFFDYFTEPQKAKEVYEEVFANGSVTDSPLTLRHTSGKLTEVLFNGSVYKDGQGHVLGVVVVARDIAEQKWALDLRSANSELAFQNQEKEKRATELSIANQELAFQNEEKEKRAMELSIANKELAYQNEEKEKRATELSIANKELAFQNQEKENRAQELVIANKELAYQNEEKENRAAELLIANEELAFQNQEKENRAQELVIANKELAYQNDEKENRAAELLIANEELAYQNQEKENRASELLVANEELAYQNKVKEKRAAELIIANKELLFQNSEKQDRADELVIADKELDFQNEEKEKRKIENSALEEYSTSLKLASQYSLSLIEASLDPLFVISPEGKITDTNQATARVTGVSKKELIGSDFIDYFTEPEKAKAGYLEVFEEGHVVDYPLTITDGELMDVLFNGAVYTDEKDNVIGAVVVARDITKQKQIEKELIEAKIFAELATAIAEEAKISAENAAEVAKEAVKSKQQFLSNMSHEIRTPMNAIIGFTKVVLKTSLTAKQKEYLTAIKMSGDALIVLINDILDLAKVNSGKMVFEKTPFKLSLSISAMLHLFETKIQEKNLKLITKYDDTIPEVLVGDAVRLHQIILNLVSNAVKFTSKGTITVSVNLIEEDDEKVLIEFTITDTGIGINSQKIETIFENFQQATSGTSRLYGGTGLGLAIVKHLVEAQEGSIHVESEEDHGSSFRFKLLFQKTNVDAVLEEEIVELDLEVKDIKILVVEDMELNQLLMKTLLDDFGFECDITANGRLAVEKLQEKTYNIILMDLQMPEMNGFEATEHIRKVMKLTVPIMALTADVTTVDLAKCKAVGMNDYVAKPIDERLLYSKIIGLVKKPILIIEEKIIGDMKTENIKYVDLKYLNKLTKSNPKLMSEMIHVYLKQTPPLIESMKQSLIDQDWVTLKSAAHKIIPSFTIMGISSDFENMAIKIQEYASNIESIGDINEMILQLEMVCNSAYIELENELDTIKNTTI
ncbi:PAS domain S-box protein [Flavobacterium sp.]|uniref:PAS domain S-box protein n=1 Tax=Flavobacterium sp. TaxID=239 RepID=UPI00286D5CA3|nr:PAS domain S-box protein [Flavobacterium sp.]